MHRRVAPLAQYLSHTPGAHVRWYQGCCPVVPRNFTNTAASESKAFAPSGWIMTPPPLLPRPTSLDVPLKPFSDLFASALQLHFCLLNELMPIYMHNHYKAYIHIYKYVYIYIYINWVFFRLNCWFYCCPSYCWLFSHDCIADLGLLGRLRRLASSG